MVTCRYLEDVPLRKLKGAGCDVDAFACLDLNAVHTFVAVVIVHWIIWRQKHSLVVGHCGAALGCRKTHTHTQNSQNRLHEINTIK